MTNIIDGVAEFFLGCPLLAEGAFRMDALGDQATEYAIEVSIFTPIIEKYLDGSSERRYQFNFTSREAYAMDRIQNMANSGFYEALADWVELQDSLGNYPEMPEGMTPEQMNVLSSGFLMDEAMQNARYQIQLEIIYHQEAKTHENVTT